MEQQLLEQVTNRLNELKNTQGQIEDTMQKLEEQRKIRSSFFVNWQNTCNHAYYKIQHPSLGICTTEEFRCCLCEKSFEAIEAIPFKDRKLYNQTNQRHREAMLDEKGPPCIGSHLEGMYVAYSPLPIPPDRQAEVDEKKRELAEIDAEQASLEEKLRTLRETVGPIKKELEDITHLLMSHFHYPQAVYETPHRWGRDDFNYDPFD